jgi:uncharacterized protein DUF1566
MFDIKILLVLVPVLAAAGCSDGWSGGFDSGITDTDTDTDSDTDTDEGCNAASAPEYTWCDETTGLLWENPHMDAPAGISWSSSSAYCANMELGDFNDWRMPIIDELRTLVRDCPGTEPGGDCGVTQSCLGSECAGSACDGCTLLGGPGGDGCYWNTDLEGICEETVYWSSSSVEDQTDHHWGIMFDTGAVLSKDDVDTDTDTDTDTEPWICDTIVRCVRGS